MWSVTLSQYLSHFLVARWNRGKGYDSYSGGTLFESRLWACFSDTIYRGFPQPRQIRRQWLKVEYDRFFLHTSQFIVHGHVIQRCVISAVDSASWNNRPNLRWTYGGIHDFLEGVVVVGCVFRMKQLKVWYNSLLRVCLFVAYGDYLLSCCVKIVLLWSTATYLSTGYKEHRSCVAV